MHAGYRRSQSKLFRERWSSAYAGYRLGFSYGDVVSPHRYDTNVRLINVRFKNVQHSRGASGTREYVTTMAAIGVGPRPRHAVGRAMPGCQLLSGQVVYRSS